MAWTSPRTWVSGEVVTAALMNTHVRDNLKAIGDARSTWTPTVTASAGTFTTVSGAGRYLQIGKLVIWDATITITTAGTASGSVRLTAPVTARAAGPHCGAGRVAAAGAGATCTLLSTTSIEVFRFDGASITAAGTIVVSGTYEAA